MAGRPKKKLEYNKEQKFITLLAEVTNAYEQAGIIRTLAAELNMTTLKLRKLLITAGVFTSDICDEVNALHQQGKKLTEIMEITGLSRASVQSYLPYTKEIYNAADLSLDAEKCRIYRERQEKIKLLRQESSEERLWDKIIVFQNYLFNVNFLMN